MTAAENLIAAMVRDFILRAGGGERIADICEKMLAEGQKGGVCARLAPEETAALRGKTPLISEAPDASGSLILDVGRDLLYTRRNWHYEDAIGRRIAEMAQKRYDAALPDDETLGDLNLNDCQKEAVRGLIRNRFAIMTGGPGTGKTYTIARAVKLIRDRQPELRIGLAAPTGKAAARLNEAMQEAAESLQLGEIAPATTLHSLLRPNPDLVTFKHDRDDPLDLDWLIVDEASMVSLPLMAKLLDAIPENCRLTLVGDANQLSSVDPGRVFGDLCDMKVVNDNGCKYALRESRRFPPEGEIAKLAGAINGGDWENALALLKNGNDRKLHYISLNDRDANTHFMDTVVKYFEPFRKCRTADEALEKLNDCRILCAVRQGRFGCETLNARVTAKLRRLDRECPIPIMITRNDPTLDVSNGDVGVVIPAAGDPEGMALSLRSEGREETRKTPLSLLPQRETAFATTIHKAQGSEFRNVIIVLPKTEPGSPADAPLTRELLYTALTRTGKGECFIYADDAAIRRCCENKTVRCTGLSVVGS